MIKEDPKDKDGQFQFTQPGWAATDKRLFVQKPETGFNSRSPDGLRLSIHQHLNDRGDVSIHAARMGCDLISK